MDVSPYDRLGVAPDADEAEIRRAWLALARAHHPDGHADAASRAAAEREMQSINEAWSILSDPQRRRRYDERWGARVGDGSVGSGPSATSARIDRPDDFVFVPFDDEDDEIDPRLLDDVGVEGTHVDRSVQVVPVVLLLGGLVGVVLGAVIALPFLVVVGAVGLVGGALSFLLAPLQAATRSIAAERRSPGGSAGPRR